MANKSYLDYNGLLYFFTKLKDYFSKKDHTHGNISNTGTVGTTANKPLITGTNGVVQAGSFGTAANTFCQGNDSRLSNARTPVAHASTDTTYGVSTDANYGHAKASSTTPKANGTAAVGTETGSFARGDHVHPLQTSVAALTNARTIDGVSFDGSGNIAHYGTCSTAAATVAKTVDLTGFTLAAGAVVIVKFTITNTGAVGSLTLNVNNTGAKSIKYKGGNLPSAGTLAANKVYEFIYDGTNYELVGDLDTNTAPRAAGSGLSLSGNTLNHSNSVTAVTNVGGNTNETPGYNSTFSVPYFSYDAQGHITASGTKTVKIPASDNVDTKVKQTADSSTDGELKLLLTPNASPTSGASAEAKYNTGLSYNPKNKQLSVDVISDFKTSKILGKDAINAENQDYGGSLTLGSDSAIANSGEGESAGVKIDHERINLSFFPTKHFGDFNGYGSTDFPEVTPTHELTLDNSGNFTWDGSAVITANTLTWANVSGKPSTFTPSSHTHGNLNNAGQVTNTTAITPANGDYLLVADASDSNKLGKSIQIGTNTTKFLRNDGTWVVPAGTYSLPAADASTRGGVTIGSNIDISGDKISVKDASTSQKGVVQLYSDTNSTSTSLAATASAVKAAYDLAASKQSPATTLAGYGITNAYTKTEVDAKLTSAMHYKGSLDFLQIPSTGAVSGKTYLKKADGSNNVSNPAVGDFYNIVEDGSNWAWTGSAWDQTGFAVEFASITNTEIDTIVAS